MQSFYYFDLSNVEQSDLLKLTIGCFSSPIGNTIDQVGVTSDIETVEGNELYEAHRDFLSNFYSQYRSLDHLQDVTEETSFLVRFTSAVDWTTFTENSFELVELGGKAYGYTYESQSDRELLVIPTESLRTNKDYYLYIHPGLKDVDGACYGKVIIFL